ncbi:MAG: PIN domain-containing protein [Patescibacteria group bacterium]
MKRAILDTNVIVRFLVKDHIKHYEQAALWFKEAEEGMRDVVITPLVIVETSFVLESFYKLKRSDIANALEVFIGQRWFNVIKRDILLYAWNYYRKGLHFVDSYLKSWSELNGIDILTFDKELSKV